MSHGNITHTIVNILDQCDLTTISIGHAEGHFISTKQVAVLRECAASLESADDVTVDTPATTQVSASTSLEDQVKGRLLEVTTLIKRRQLELANAQSVEKPSINLELGKLWSERAKLDKLSKQFDALTL